VDSTGSPQVESSFDKLSRGSFTLYIHRDFHNDTFEQTLLAGGRELHERYHPIPVRSSKFTDVYRFGVRFGDIERVVYLKEYFCRSAWDFVKHLFRPSRARRELEAGLMLAENGFESPCVIAMGQRKFAFLTTRSFVATLEVGSTHSTSSGQAGSPQVENAQSVYQMVRHFDKAQGRQAHHRLQERRSFIKEFGRTIGRMHAEGIFHGDLRLGNVLVRKEVDGWHFFFLDNERTKKFRRLPERLRLKNLVQVNMLEPGAVSNTDRMRFFKEYWAENKESGLEKAARVRQAHRKLVKKVLKRTKRRLRKKMRV
jgi:tRNA A-37 threonylcarbamoyl transferase component Bud32